MRLAFFSRSRSVTLSRSSGETLAAGGKKPCEATKNSIAKQKRSGKMRLAFFSRSRSVTLSRSSGETLAAGGKNKKSMRAPRPHAPGSLLHPLHRQTSASCIFYGGLEIPVPLFRAFRYAAGGRPKKALKQREKWNRSLTPTCSQISLISRELSFRRRAAAW